MALRLQGDARRVRAEEAYELHIARVSNRQIAERMGIGRELVATLIKEQAANYSEHQSTERAKAIATYDSMISQARQRLVRIQDNSLNVSGLINAVISAQKAIDEITGVRAQDQLGDANEALMNFKIGMDTMEKVQAMKEQQGWTE
jgi:hypothetical protein